ncbi:MAG: Y-family DNA polymerase [Bacteroidales bacterium]|nr:Y-family DNA polymerase [Bacteroidales bacterium]
MYALVDCNNFFVSCERAFQPQLEGRPVVVLSNNDGCVVSRSNESKAMGIKMCTPFYKIKHLVDAGCLYARSSNYALYGDLSARVMSILADAVPKIEVYSIDEAFLVMDGIGQEKQVEICRGLVSRIRKWVGIPVSIGVAQTKTLAKAASHFAKKYPGYHGVCVIDTEEKRDKALSIFPIGEVWGVGRRNLAKMTDAGISTAADFVARPRQWVSDNFMLQGLRTWNELRGMPCVSGELPDKRKSICTSRSFADMVGDRQELAAKVADFAAQCADKLRKENTVAGKVTVFMWTNRFRDDLEQYCPSATVCLPVAASNTQEIVSAAMRGMDIIYRDGFLYKKAGVIVDDIMDADSVQPAMFDFDMEQRRKHDVISAVMDRLNGNSISSRPVPGGRAGLLRMASQSAGCFSDGIRTEYRSRHFTTDFDDILEVFCRTDTKK